MTERVNVTTDEDETSPQTLDEFVAGTGPGSVSNDGRFVTLQSGWENVDLIDHGGFSQIYLRDRVLGTTEHVSITHNGNQADGDSDSSFVSDDGQVIAFRSSATNMIPDDTNGLRDVFFRLRRSGETDRASVGPVGRQGSGDNRLTGVDPDGQSIYFGSFSPEFTTASDSAERAYVYDRGSSAVSQVPLTSRFYGTLDVSADGRWATYSSIAGPGSTVKFSCRTPNGASTPRSTALTTC